MKKLYTLLLLAFICSSANAQQFIPTNGPTSGKESCKFVYVDDDVMYTGYNYNLLRSDDGGQTWNIVTANFTDIEILPTSMIRKDNYLFLTSWLGDDCYRSSDNGNSWEVINSGLGINPYATSPNRIEVSGDNLIMSAQQFAAISTDMGLSWQQIEGFEGELTDGLNQLESGLYISSEGNQVPFSDQFIYKSLDNGITWEQLPSVPFIDTGFSILEQGSSAFAELNGYLYSSTTLNGNGLMRSNDNGQTWEIVGESYAFNTGHYVRNYDGVLYFTDLYGAYRSTDEGETWEVILDQSYNMDEHAGYITRHDGKIWITTGKGPVSYNEMTGEVSNPTIPNSSLHHMKAANGVILGLEAGKLYSSVDYGNTWTNITGNIGDGNDIISYSLDGGDWYACAAQNTIFTIFKSIDNGQTWTAIQTVEGGASAFFSYNPKFYAKGKGADLAIYKSSDDGVTWNETTLTVEGDPLFYTATVQGFEKHGDLIFADILNGFAFSADAGETWTVRSLPSDGKVVGWSNKFLRLQDNGSGYQIQESTDDGVTWTMTTDGFPNLAGVIQYATGIGMVNGRVYVQNTMASGDLSDYPGYYYYIENGSSTWAPAISLGQIPYNSLEITGTTESDLYISTQDHGVWTNVHTIVGVENTKTVKTALRAYPNPANDQLYVECEVTDGILSIMDISGRVVSQIPFKNNKQEINISSLTSGMYIINIHGENKHFQSKIIKQ